jgi:Mor family transcriptional regulator
MQEDWLKEVAADMTLDDFGEGYRQVAEVCGVEAALSLARATVCGRIYVPKFEALVRPRRDARIRQEFNGANHRDLSRKYNLSESQIRNILAQKPAEQGDLFDD